MNIWRWLFGEPSEWKVLGYSKTCNWTRGLSSSFTSRAVVVCNQKGDRDIWILYSNVEAAYDRTFIKTDTNIRREHVSSKLMNAIWSTTSIAKINAEYNCSLVEYTDSNYTWEEFRDNFIFGKDKIESSE